MKTIKCLYTRYYGLSLLRDEIGTFYIYVYGNKGSHNNSYNSKPIMTTTVYKFEYANEVFGQLERDLRNAYYV